MKQSGLRLVPLALCFLVLTIVLGCSSGKAFKSGVTYTCDEGKIIVVEVYEKADMALLKIEKKRFYLPRVPSASGTKYSEGKVTLWIEGQTASVEIEGQTEFENCFVKPK
jgi:membrane-bound inhibitor of C-type lysozyme